jgi:hypothetical protein
MSIRFDYIAYDETAHTAQARCKMACVELEAAIDAIGAGGAREKAIAMTQLEHVYARCGRAIRDDQISRNGSAPLQEKRGNE